MPSCTGRQEAGAKDRACEKTHTVNAQADPQKMLIGKP